MQAKIKVQKPELFRVFHFLGLLDKLETYSNSTIPLIWHTH